MQRRLSLSGALVAAFMLLVVPTADAQQGTVAGTVTDEGTGQPLPAVQMVITGTSMGTLTQQDGRYLLLNVPVGTYTLTAERIGYGTVTQEITVAAGETVRQNFVLSQEALGLDEIIITGTPGGTQRRAIGNSVTTVEAAELTQAVAVSNMQELLTGRAPGVQFVRANGNVGTGSPLQIRGVGSFNLESDPLIFVDGIRVNNDSHVGPSLGDMREVNPLADFNPQDIASIEIIKGPAAATLYGTEASAGVIQIITKRGAEGDAQFDLSVSQGTNFLRDPAGRVGTRWSCRDSYTPPCTEENGGLFSYNPYEEGNRLIAEGAFPWPQDELYRYGHTQSYNLGVRGGTETIRYFLSANYDNDQGIVFYNWDKTSRLRANISVVFSENFSLDVSTGYVDGKTRFMQQAEGDGGVWEDLVWGNGYCLPRINPGECPRLMGFQEHLPSDVAKLEVTRAYNRFTGSGTLNFTSGGWLTSRAIVGLDKGWDENTSYWPLETQLTTVYEETATGRITLERPVTTNLSLDWSTTADLDLNATWGTATSVGAQYYIERFSSFANTGIGFPSPLSRTINQTPPANADINFEFIEDKSLGVYVQEQVSWNDRIFVTGAVRFDDNSAFGSEFDLETYPKVSGTWVISDESFWNFDLVNTLRLRGAWGKAGRQPDTFAGTNQYGVIPGVGGTAALNPTNPGNPEVGPEVSTELELGFDAALLDDRVAAQFTWFTQKNEDALLSVPLPPTAGFAGATQRNLGRIDNWGWEAMLNTRIYESPAFSFGLDFTGSHVDNEIKSLGTFPGTNAIRIGFPYPNYTLPYYVVDAEFDPDGPYQNAWGERVSALCDSGVPLGEGPEYGVTRGGEPVPCEEVPELNLLQGPAFYTYVFSVTPRISLFNNTVQIHVMADGAYGKTLHSTNDAGHDYNNSLPSRTEKDPLIVTADWLGSFQHNGLFDADFWKLREIGVRYDLPESLTGRIGANRASVSFSGRELWTIWRKQPTLGTGHAVGDPETSRARPSESVYRAMPPLTSFDVTVRVSF